MSCDVYVLVLFLLFSLHNGNSSSETKWPKLDKRKHILNRPLKMTLTYSGRSRMYWLGRGWGLENTQGRKDGWRKQYMKTFGVVDMLIIFLSCCTCMLTYQRRKKLEEGRKEGRKILVLLWNLDLEIIMRLLKYMWAQKPNSRSTILTILSKVPMYFHLPNTFHLYCCLLAFSCQNPFPSYN